MADRTAPEAPLAVLYLEDSERDRILVEAVLVREGGPFRLCWARDREEYLAGLERPDLDLVLSDFVLDAYDGMAALKACRERHPLLPFILVSGHVGEERVVECLRQGATDYVSKHNLGRLPLVILRAMAEVRERTARLRTEAVKTALLQAATIARVVPWKLELPSRTWVFEESATAVLGYTPREFREDPALVERLIHRDDRHRFISAQAAAGGAKPVGFHCRMQTRAGDLWTRWTLAASPDLVQGVLQDVSELHATQDQLIQSQKAETASVLVSGLCHDFNNLIAAIAGCAATLALEDLSGDQRETVAAIQQATERSQDLVRQLLGFARKNQEPRKVLRSVNSLTQEAATLLGHVHAEGVRLETELDPEAGEAWVEPGQIVQVLLNLGMNALDALSGPGRITLRTGRQTSPPAPGCDRNQKPCAFLEVEDSGCGIPGAILGRIYDPFFTTKPPGQGTGLGLAMVQAIVKDHDGQLQCQSEPGCGTRFRILLPEAQSPAPEPGPAPREEPGRPLRAGATVLLADDDDAFRTSWARTIRKAFQFQVLEARDGREAVALFRQHAGAIDLVILDRRMPGLSGPEAFAAMLRIRPGTLGILCSADAPAAFGAAPEQGFRVCLRKPFSLKELDAGLRQAGSLRPG